MVPGASLAHKSGWSVKLTTRLHLQPRLRMSEATPPYSLYAFNNNTSKRQG